jgi:hypothetical protein
MKAHQIRSIEIPDDEQGVLAGLARLADPALDGLERALNKAVPTLDKRSLVAQLRLEPLMADVPDLENIIGSLVSFAGTAYSGQIDVDEFADIVAQEIRNDGVIELSSSETSLLAERLKRLTRIECLEIIAKGNVLLRANDRNFQSAAIASDLRPVCFGSELRVAASVILHQLAIKTSHNGRPETIYIALDSEDLASLEEVVTRAAKKERSFREFLGRSATPVLVPPAGE